MNYSQIVAIAALGFVTAGCATTKKVGSGAFAVAKAPFQVADAALTGTERVLNIANKAVSIAEKTSNLVPILPGSNAKLSIAAVQAQAGLIRSAFNGFGPSHNNAKTIADTYGSYASAAYNQSCNTTPIQSYRAAASTYRAAGQPYAPTISNSRSIQSARPHTVPNPYSNPKYRPSASYSSRGTRVSSTNSSTGRTHSTKR